MPCLAKREYGSPVLRVCFFNMKKTETKARSASVLRVLTLFVGEGMKILWGMLDACIPLEPIALGHVRNYGSTIAPPLSTTRSFKGVYEAVGRVGYSSIRRMAQCLQRREQRASGEMRMTRLPGLVEMVTV